MAIPETIEREHILKAIERIRKEGVPGARKSTKYDVVFRGGKFPPKYTLSIACSYAEGRELPPNEFFGGSKSNNFLIARGFQVNDRAGKPVGLVPAEEDEEEYFFEGGKKLRKKHVSIERDSTLAKKVKGARLKKDKFLKCDVCDFSFHRAYGARGAGFIEAHHTTPVSELGRRRRVLPSEIALVCSNCHRILHRTRPWLSIKELRGILSKEGRAKK